MKIRELYIDGFGHFHDQHIGPFLSPVVVLHGPNEAGKTTLLAFIRTIRLCYTRVAALQLRPRTLLGAMVKRGQPFLSCMPGACVVL